MAEKEVGEENYVNPGWGPTVYGPKSFVDPSGSIRQAEGDECRLKK